MKNDGAILHENATIEKKYDKNKWVCYEYKKPINQREPSHVKQV